MVKWFSQGILFSGIIILSGCQQQVDSTGVKNIILMISDGCGYNHVAATSMFQHGMPDGQIYHAFPVQYGVSTYSLDSPVYDPAAAWRHFDYVLTKPTDSAASGTAIACGIKTNNGKLGVDSSGRAHETIAERAERLGKATGVVSSVLFNHATPAVFLAHNESRHDYPGIAREMIRDSGAEVIMGCGHPEYNDNGEEVEDPDYSSWDDIGGWMEITAGIEGADADGDELPDRWHFIDRREQFQGLQTGDTPKRIFGLAPVAATLQQQRSGDENALPFEVPLIASVPTLEEMTGAALNVVDNDPDGFFLMIEGGAVDWAGHANQSGRMIEEQIGFNEAIGAVIQWIEKNSSWDETLLIITADHETGYLSGPCSGDDSQRIEGDVADVWCPIVNNGAGSLPGIEWHSEAHTNQLIPLYAKGNGSEGFQRFADQTDPVHGKYIDNTEIALLVFELWPSGE
jgi:alkaline phosphatase